MLYRRALALLFIPVLVSACSGESVPPPNTNIQATIEAQVQATLEHKNQSTPIDSKPQTPVSIPDPTVQIESSGPQNTDQTNNSSNADNPSELSVPLNKDEAVFLYPPNSTQSLLAGFLEWPSGFDQCIKESIS